MMQRIIKAQNGNPDVNSEDLKLGIFTKEVLAEQD
jgi:hypothetical protein